MSANRISTLATAVALSLAGTVHAASDHGFSLQVLLAGTPRPEYHARDAIYVEAVRGRDYTLRLTNPLPARVAVALAVDGLNSLDARHGDAASAAKWVLNPYESIEISGWQTSGSEARRFFFTGERSSYGAWLGQTDNLGVIEAVFYREKPRRVVVHPVLAPPRLEEKSSSGEGELRSSPSGKGMGATGAAEGASPRLSDDYAATGIGAPTRHEVEWVELELEDKPTARVRIRYEFREQLARLGVLPAPSDPFERREAAHGFAPNYCPDPFVKPR